MLMQANNVVEIIGHDKFKPYNICRTYDATQCRRHDRCGNTRGLTLCLSHIMHETPEGRRD